MISECLLSLMIIIRLNSENSKFCKYFFVGVSTAGRDTSNGSKRDRGMERYSHAILSCYKWLSSGKVPRTFLRVIRTCCHKHHVSSQPQRYVRNKRALSVRDGSVPNHSAVQPRHKPLAKSYLFYCLYYLPMRTIGLNHLRHPVD